MRKKKAKRVTKSVSQRGKVPLDKKREAVLRLENGDTAGNLAVEYGVTSAAIYQWRQLFKKESKEPGKLPVAAKSTGSVKKAINRLPAEVQDALTYLREANDLIGAAWKQGREPDDAHVAAMQAYKTLMRLLRKRPVEE